MQKYHFSGNVPTFPAKKFFSADDMNMAFNFVLLHFETDKK